MRRPFRLLFAITVVAGLPGLWVAATLRPPAIPVPGRDFDLVDVTVVNPGLDRREHVDLTLRRGQIATISPHVPGAAPSPAWAASLAGAIVVPGIVDMHVHHPPMTPLGDTQLWGLLFLAHGVTAVRDTGSFDGRIFELRRRRTLGEEPGPRTFACGPILDGDPPFWPGSRVVRNATDGITAVREIARAGASCIKIYDGVGPEALEAIRQEAHDRGLKVVGHVPSAVGLAESHLDDVQHLTGVLGWDGSLTAGRIDAVVVASRVERMAHTPTIVVRDRLLRLSLPGGYEAALAEPSIAALPRWYREILWDPAHDRRLRANEGRGVAEVDETLRTVRGIVRELWRAGVRVHVGTDTGNPFVLPGGSAQEEMRHLEQAGLPAEAVWAAATRDAGDSLGLTGLGRLVPGAPADLIVLRRDPSRDLRALTDLEAVASDGRLYSRAMLDAGLAAHRRQASSRVFEEVTMRIARLLSRRGAAP